MSDRYDLLIAAMKASNDAVLILAAFGIATLAARWSIKLIPEKIRGWVYNAFDLWLILAVLYIYLEAK